jgi:uncharacterized protein YkwD
MTEPMRRTLRTAVVAASIAVAVFAGLGGSWGSAPASAAPRTAAAAPLASPRELEVELIGRINDLRSSKGLRPLVEDRADLTELARSWSAAMARDGGISHRPDLTTAAPADWVHIGENVGVGGSIAALHDAFVASPMHHRNLVDPAFESVAVGIVVRDGRIWVTENFLTAAKAGETPDPSTVQLTAPPGGLGHRTCVTDACRRRGVFRRITFTRL